MKIIEMTVTDLESVATSGTSLRSLKAKDLTSGIYSVIELKDIELKSKQEVTKAITEHYGETPGWCDNLPESNVSGFARLKTGDKTLGVYMNNALFNLMLEGKALKSEKSNNKISVSLTGKSFKI